VCGGAVKNLEGTASSVPQLKIMPGLQSHGEIGRKHPVHQPVFQRGNQVVIVFVTVNAHQRKPILAKTDAANVILSTWKQADTWRVGRYVIMPDHIHFFCAPRDLSVSLRCWMKFWKSQVSLRWPRPDEQPVWQLDFWDTQLRRGESYSEKWDYVWRNPVRKGLATRPEDWPYAGESNVLVWHDK
jgi:REP element-mobilizing transposase RayT